jgi:hypothetical protein
MSAPEGMISWIGDEGKKRKYVAISKRPRLVWMHGRKITEKMYLLHLRLMYGGDYQDSNAAEEFELMFGSVFQIAHKYLPTTLMTAIMPYLVCCCRGRGACKAMAPWVTPYVNPKSVFNGMVNSLRQLPGYQALMDRTRASLDDSEHEHGWPKPPFIGSNYESASDDSDFEDDVTHTRVE